MERYGSGMRVSVERLENRQHLSGSVYAINFQPGDVPRAPGMLTDYGATYAIRRGGYSYGWDVDSTAAAVDRNVTQVQRNDTFIAMQSGGVNRTWSMAVDNGVYSVYVVGGDPAAFNDRMAITVEGQVAASGITRSSRRYLEGSVEVSVSDGKITLGNAAWAVSDKLAYLAIQWVKDLPPVDPPIVDPPIVNPPIVDPTVGKTLAWKTTTSLPQAKAEAFSAAVDGKLYAFGGYFDSTFLATDSAYAFNPATRMWATLRALPLKVAQAATASDSRYVYFAGGYVTSGSAQTFATKKAYRYDTATDTYAALPDLPAARGPGAMAIVGRSLMFLGGGDSSRKDVATVYALDLDNTAAGWQSRASMPAARNRFGVAVTGGSLYVVGGQTANDAAAVYSSSVWRYDVSTDAWTPLASMPTARSHIAASTLVLNGKIVVAGGEGAGRKALNKVERYNPATNTWSTLTSLPATRFSGISGVIDGKLYFAGGYNGAFSKSTWAGTFA